MTPVERVKLVRNAYGAYESGDRRALEELLRREFRFSSPADVDIARATYFERCWPNAETIARYDFVRLAELGDEVVATYEATKTDGRQFRNTEIFRFDGDRIARTEVYFGWNLE
jgi:ketosteroid isomerase-like protein